MILCPVKMEELANELAMASAALAPEDGLA